MKLQQLSPSEPLLRLRHLDLASLDSTEGSRGPFGCLLYRLLLLLSSSSVNSRATASLGLRVSFPLPFLRCRSSLWLVVHPGRELRARQYCQLCYRELAGPGSSSYNAAELGRTHEGPALGGVKRDDRRDQADQIDLFAYKSTLAPLLRPLSTPTHGESIAIQFVRPSCGLTRCSSWSAFFLGPNSTTGLRYA